MPTVDNLNIQIISSARTAVGGIDALTASLGRLNATSKSGTGLNAISKQINNIAISSKGISPESATKLQQLTTALQRLSSVGNLKISSSIGTQITKIGQAVSALGTTDFSAINRLAAGLAPLASLGKAQLGSFISQLSRLPKLAAELATMDLTKFISQMEQLAVAMTPLADKMNKISAGFAALPTKIKGVVSGLNSVTTAAPKSGSALGLLNTSLSGSIMKFGVFYAIIRRVKDVLASFITNSMEYTENLNLFNVSMGDYAQAAMEYGKKVQSVMGIDLSEWVRNQGIFMQLTTGFGIADASAASMSKTMTQLSYDLASLFNSDVETAMQKVQSGLAGELEPLRRWGYDLSVAKLQEVALSLGIDKRVISMTQADKAQLRFIAIMQQSNNAVGDMARTLITPANAMRIMSQLIERLKRAIGNMLIPVLSAVMPYIMAFTTVLIDAANALANLMGFMDVKIDYSNLGAGLSTATDDLDGVTASAGSAAAAIKAFTLGFDQLNVVPDQASSGSGSSGGGGTDWGIDYSSFEYDFLANANTKVADIVKSMKEALAPLEDAFGKLGTSLGPLMDQLKTFWDEYLVPFGLWTIGTGLPALVDVLTSIFEWFNKHPETTKALAEFAAACLVLSKIGSIAIGIKATLTGLGLLGPALSGAGGAAAVGGLTIGATLMIAAASIGVAYIIGSLVVDAANTAWNNETPQEKAGVTGAGSTGNLSALDSTLGKDLSQGNYFKALTDSSHYIQSFSTTLPLWKQAENESLRRLEASGNYIQAVQDSWNANVLGHQTDNGKKVYDELFGGHSMQDYIYQQNASAQKPSISGGVSSPLLTASGSYFGNNPKQTTGSYFGEVDETTLRDQNRTYQDYLAQLGTSTSKTYSTTTETINIETKKAAKYMQSNIGGGIEGITDSFGGLPTDVQNKMAVLSSAVSSGSDKVGTSLSGGGGGIQSSVKKATDVFGSMSPTVLNHMTNLTTTVGTGSGKAGSALSGGITSGVKGVITGIGGMLTSAQTGISGFSSGVSVGIAHVNSSIINSASSSTGLALNTYAGFSNAVSRIFLTLDENVKKVMIHISTMMLSLPKNLSVAAVSASITGLMTSQVKGISMYANGGFPDRGQMFIAREAGPEMVGNIGSRSAVVNNSQIIQGITQGVAQGVAQAMGSSSKEDSGDMNFYIDGMLGFTLSAADRKNARSAHTVVTVGGS